MAQNGSSAPGVKQTTQIETSIMSVCPTIPSSSGNVATPTTVCAEMTRETKIQRMTEACRTILECIGEDPDREGLVKTPHRWAEALMFFSSGYEKKLEDVTNNAVFSEPHLYTNIYL
uniref:GTP cyclohydrolase 1 n=1 Tax=Corethron hystrix TaxID=216773 RepID=A0A7S1BAD2_9STRA|mmetsp:Transcript_19316/g.44014  ORF Transcript_19316/g.44014 Transcript_19316/m.44014 type:complete len:117 (+) Transcript_19316:311-661(+)